MRISNREICLACLGAGIALLIDQAVRAERNRECRLALETGLAIGQAMQHARGEQHGKDQGSQGPGQAKETSDTSKAAGADGPAGEGSIANYDGGFAQHGTGASGDPGQ